MDKNLIFNLINSFFESLNKNLRIKLYNEAGFQHELGYYLRSNGLDVYFEYNINLINGLENNKKNIYLKKELDLYILYNNNKYCIEIKFPRKGAYPRRMMQSIIDIYFLKQLKNNNFYKNFFIFITDLPNFKEEGNEKEGIYKFFRNAEPLSNFTNDDIPKFMNNSKEVNILKKNINSLKLNNYKIEFKNLLNNNILFYYFILEV